MGIVFYISVTVLISSVLLILLRKPSQERRWVPEHSVPANAEICGDTIILKNIVHADYSDAHTCTVQHYDKTFNIKDVETLWLLIEIFPMRVGPISFNLAHSFLTFEFKDGSFISISVAGRRKLGEHVTFSRVLPHKNEIVYKVINEADTIFARSFKDGNELRLYKLKVTRLGLQNILLSKLSDINKLHNKPGWFDTFTRNCTTEVVRHLRAGGMKIPLWHPSYIFTTGLDKLLYNYNIIETELPFCNTQRQSNVTPIAQELGPDPELSKKIRSKY